MKIVESMILAASLLASSVAWADRVAYGGVVDLKVESPILIVEHHHDWKAIDKTSAFLRVRDRATGAELFTQPAPALTYLWISPDSKYIVGLSHIMLANPYQIVVIDWTGARLLQEDMTDSRWPKVRRTVTNFVYWYDEPEPKIELKESPARVSLTISDEEGARRIFRFPPTSSVRPAPAATPSAAKERPSLTYELYELTGPSGSTLLAKGTKEYSVRDIIIGEQGEQRGVHFVQKELPIANGMAVGASVYREKSLTGFGMWLKDREGEVGKTGRGGISWEWFTRESRDIYRKIQGGGRVRVVFVPSSEFEEIQAIEVIEDIRLRLKDQSVFSLPSGPETHHLILRKGSVLAFGP